MVKLEVSVPISYTRETLENELVKILPIEKSEIRELEIVKRILSVKPDGNLYKTYRKNRKDTRPKLWKK